MCFLPSLFGGNGQRMAKKHYISEMFCYYILGLFQEEYTIWRVGGTVTVAHGAKASLE